MTNPATIARRRLAATHPRLPFEPTETWRHAARAKLRELLRMPGDVREVARVEERDANIVVEATTDDPADGYLPRPATPTRSAVLAVPGHGEGVDGLVGRGTDGGYQNDFALTLARRGHLVLAFEPVAFGRRRSERARAKGPDELDCHEAATASLLMGQTLLGWRVAEALAAVHWLAEQPGIDRVGLCGISGGGTVALMTAALSDRVTTAYVSGYLAAWTGSIAAMHHCVCNFVPDLATWFRVSDVAALIAPRTLVTEAGDADAIFPPPAVSEAVAATRAAFAQTGGTFHHHDFPGAHVFNGGGLDVFDAALQ
jgi:dienelactone hydrolase